MLPQYCFAGRRARFGVTCVATSALIAAVSHTYAQVPLVSAPVTVAPSLQASPFNTQRYLNVPSGYAVSVYTRISAARFLTVTPSGDLLVSQPSTGKVKLVRANGASTPLVTDFLTGLSRPHDLVFHTIGSTTYLYVSENNQIDRYVYTNGDLTGQGRQIVISNLPSASLPELHGSYGHELKNIALDANHKLYVSIGSATNADPSDTTAVPKRAAIYQYNADGTGTRLFAQGLRNAEGLAIVPGTPNNLWVCVNNRDNIAYPFHSDWDHDGSDDYGKVIQSFVDNHPPEEFTHVRDGGNYGWPFANPNPDTANGYDNMPFDLDVQNNADGSHGAVASFDRIDKGIQAHSAPLSVTFLGGTQFASAYRNGALLALHGSWNRSVKTGYKVIYFPWNTTTQKPGAQADFVTGWVDAAGQNAWGRPVDTAVDASGNLFISDDSSGTVYKLTPAAPPASVTIQPAADATVQDGVYAATNFGLANTLLVKGGAPVNYNRMSYLRFDLSTLPATIQSAKLRVYGRHNTSGGASPITTVYGSSVVNWGERTINWNNKPALGAAVASTHVGNALQYYEWDVTAYLAAQRSTGAATLVLSQPSLASDNFLDQYSSREVTANPPLLVVTGG